jgi:hypothetical protein
MWSPYTLLLGERAVVVPLQTRAARAGALSGGAMDRRGTGRRGVVAGVEESVVDDTPRRGLERRSAVGAMRKEGPVDEDRGRAKVLVALGAEDLTWHRHPLGSLSEPYPTEGPRNQSR